MFWVFLGAGMSLNNHSFITIFSVIYKNNRLGAIEENRGIILTNLAQLNFYNMRTFSCSLGVSVYA